MRRIRMERVDIEDVDPSTMSVLGLPLSSEAADVEWLCGHCDEPLIRRASGEVSDSVVLRCPHCFRFCRFQQFH